MSAIDRRQFLERMLALGGGALATAALLSLLSCSREPTTQPPTDNTTPSSNMTPPSDVAYMAVAREDNPTNLVRRSIDALGGIGRFVKPGNDVIIKPNICVPNRAPRYAATTNPEVVAALVTLCLGAGAGRVRVMDNPFGGPAKDAYADSGIGDAVREAGGEMEVMANMKFQDTPIPNGQAIKSCRVYQDIVDTDVLIDVPIAKHHSGAVLSLGMKNLLGVVSNPGDYHSNMAERVTDLTSLVMPDLTVVDAIRILTKDGPTGGNLNDVKQMNTIIASHDIVAADSYAATLFGKIARDVPIVYAGARRGLGTMDLSSVKIKEI
jgi:uncharacterized protein (DUF362 family)